MPRVRAASLSGYFEVARFVGLDPDRMLRRAGIEPAILADPERQLPAGPVIALLEASARESGCATFGLLMAESRSVASVGAVSLLLKHEGTAREVIDALVEYQGLIAEALAISVREFSDATIIHTEILGAMDAPQATEYMMGMVCRMIREVTAGRWHPETAHFLHRGPKDLRIHQRVFQCALTFRSAFNGLACATESLDAPNPAADSIMARHARRYLDMLVPVSAEGSITERARRSIYLLAPEGRATLELVGENLGLHARTLQRLLEKEGRTFANLLNEVRRELALRYLSSSSHNVTSIAQMTGYSTPSSFTRWFTAEFGVAPAAWRADERREMSNGSNRH